MRDPNPPYSMHSTVAADWRLLRHIERASRVIPRLCDDLTAPVRSAGGLPSVVVGAGVSALLVVTRGDIALVLPSEDRETSARGTCVANSVPQRSRAIVARANVPIPCVHAWCQHPRFRAGFCVDIVGAA